MVPAPRSVVVGSGPIGTSTALLLAEAGHRVVVVTRSGAGPEHPLVTRRRADASDADVLTALVSEDGGAAALYNCANPPYHRWAADWPRLASALLTAATRSGAVLVTMSNLYGYPPGSSPMTEQTPLSSPTRKGRIRAQMWQEALTAHRSGAVRVTEARASDYVGPRVTDGGHLGARVVPSILAGKTVRVLGNPDAPHTWSYVGDVARTLVTLGSDERAWGAAWHVPSPEPRSQRQMITLLAEQAGVPSPRVSAMPRLALRAAGLVIPMVRELAEVSYQLEEPFVMDSSLAQATFGLTPTPEADVVASTVAYWRERGAAAA